MYMYLLYLYSIYTISTQYLRCIYSILTLSGCRQEAMVSVYSSTSLAATVMDSIEMRSCQYLTRNHCEAQNISMFSCSDKLVLTSHFGITVLHVNIVLENYCSYT